MKQSTRRDATVSTRLTSKEFDRLSKLGQKKGLTLSTLVRTILLESTAVKTRKKSTRSHK